MVEIRALLKTRINFFHQKDFFIKPSLWTVNFISNKGIDGAGVVTLLPGKISGGDGAYYYFGDLNFENGIGTVEISIEHYFGPTIAIFGNLKSFKLKISGQYQEPVMELDGHLVENPNMKISIKCVKRAEL